MAINETDKNKTLKEVELEKIRQKYSERFNRWQQLTLGQFSNVNNLILSLTIGLLAFIVTQIGIKIPENCLLLFLIALSYFSLLISLLTGVLLTINRLNDFRKTKDIAKYKKQRFESKNFLKNYGDITVITQKIDDLKNESDKLGQKTWSLLRIQIWTFFIGSFLSIIAIIIQNNN
jgi:hypothetical protein